MNKNQIFNQIRKEFPTLKFKDITISTTRNIIILYKKKFLQPPEKFIFTGKDYEFIHWLREVFKYIEGQDEKR